MEQPPDEIGRIGRTVIGARILIMQGGVNERRQRGVQCGPALVVTLKATQGRRLALSLVALQHLGQVVQHDLLAHQLAVAVDVPGKRALCGLEQPTSRPDAGVESYLKCADEFYVDDPV